MGEYIIEKNVLINKPRNTKFEILRIIAMIMIIIHHFSAHGEFNFPAGVNTPKLWCNLISVGGQVGVNVFVFISGYFLIVNKNVKINIKKIIKIWSPIFFYSIFFMVIMLIVNDFNISFVSLFSSFFPIISSSWWFASAYIVLYIFHPFINKLLYNLDKTNYKIMLIVMTIFWSVIPTFTTIDFQLNNFLWFLYLYCLIGYIRIYGINSRFNAKHYLLFFLIFLFITYISSVVFDFMGLKWSVFDQHATYFYGKEKLNILILSLSLFMLFKSIETNYFSRIINYIASLTFGVYLIHDHFFIRNLLWVKIFKNNTFQNSILIIPYSVLVTFIVFMCCCIIEIIRKILFDKIMIKFFYFFFDKIIRVICLLFKIDYKKENTEIGDVI